MKGNKEEKKIKLQQGILTRMELMKMKMNTYKDEVGANGLMMNPKM